MKTLERNISGIDVPQIYVAPAVKIIEIEVEKGFESTPDLPASAPPNPSEPDSSPLWGAPW